MLPGVSRLSPPRLLPISIKATPTWERLWMDAMYPYCPLAVSLDPSQDEPPLFTFYTLMNPWSNVSSSLLAQGTSTRTQPHLEADQEATKYSDPKSCALYWWHPIGLAETTASCDVRSKVHNHLIRYVLPHLPSPLVTTLYILFCE